MRCLTDQTRRYRDGLELLSQLDCAQCPEVEAALLNSVRHTMSAAAQRERHLSAARQVWEGTGAERPPLLQSALEEHLGVLEQLIAAVRRIEAEFHQRRETLAPRSERIRRHAQVAGTYGRSMRQS
jgi:DNA-binding protein H-NS